MKTSTYLEAFKAGHTRVWAMEFRSNITIARINGKMSIRIEASQTTTTRDIYDEITYIPAQS